jgi:hypothetical protein
VTGRASAVVVPAVVWTFLIFTAAMGTNERDLAISSKNWVGVATMLAGSATFGIVGYRMVFEALPPRPPEDKPALGKK